jgi:carbamate kinase
VPGGISESNGRIEAERIEIGSDVATPLRQLTPDAGRALDMPTGSMGPKVTAACDFAGHAGVSGIARLADALAILDGSTGTRVPQES